MLTQSSHCPPLKVDIIIEAICLGYQALQCMCLLVCGVSSLHASVGQGGVPAVFRMDIITPTDYVGPLMELAQARRGDFKDMTYLTETRTTLVYDMPLAEVGSFVAHSLQTV